MPAYDPAIVVPRGTRNIISTLSIESIGPELCFVCAGAAAGTGNNYPAVNLAIFVPFMIAEPIIVVKMWIFNGTAVAGNIDLGIYDTAGNRLVSKGTTAQAGTSTIQELDITDTALAPGTYYMAIASDTSGITQKVVSMTVANVGLARACGVYQMATAFALPNPATFAVYAQTVVPVFGLTTRTLVV